MARAICAVSLLLVVCPTAGAHAQQADRSLQFSVENDLIAIRGAGRPPDYDYTHGTRIAVAWPSAPVWARRLVGGYPDCRPAVARERGCVTSALELGQEIYTPRRDAAAPIQGERPYAGWLYTSAVARLVAPGRVSFLRLTVGMTGRPALAAEVQNALHRLLRNEPQLGWAHQLPFQPGFALSFGSSHDRERPLGGSGASRFGLSWGAMVGNLRAGLHAGVDAKVGLRANLPWVATDPEIDQPMPLYALVGVRGERVLRDVFIEGNELPGTPGAERRPHVGQYEVGIGARGRAFAVEYRHVVRGREYVAQPGAHAYGSLVFTLHEF